MWFKLAFTFIGGATVSFLGGWDMMLKILVLFVVLDYFTGLIAAWYQKTLNSQVGFRGIAKKVLLFVPIAVGYCLDQLLGTDMLRSLAVCGYIVNEGVSIFENLGKCDVWVPKALKDALEQLRRKGDVK
jgi:toxin secretion/phage lysis holin